MIRFVCGRSGSGKSEYVMNAVKEAGRACEDIILIVPEQQAVAWESRIAREPELGSVLTLEVLTFTRLCDRVAREYGGFFHNCATKAAKRLLMWAALESVRDGLVYYNNARSERLVPALLKTVKELHTYRVDAAALETAAESLGGGDTTEMLLSRKLHDIATVYSAYDTLLKESFNDNDDMPEHTASAIAEKGFFKGKTVFIDSFYSYTPAQRDIIISAMRDAHSVTLTFSCPANKTAEPQFAHIRDYFDRMKSYAADYGGCEIIAMDEPKRFTKSAIVELERGIWDFGKKNVAEDSEGVKLVFARDRYCEGDAAASEICRLVMDGARYSDIAVIARSTESLEGITDAALQRKGIPHYTARRRELEGSPAAQLITAALRAAAYGWRREDILAIAKTGLMSIGDDECDVFEKYVNMWRIRGERAYALDGDFGMDPMGYKGGDEERSQAILDLVNNARRTVCEPLSAFCEIFRKGAARAEDCAVALYKLLTDWGVPGAISAKAAELRSLGYTEESAECLRMWDALMSVLNTLATTIPDGTGDAESFAVMLSQVIAATDVGTIPTGIDEVSLGSADMMRTENPRHVIIIGAVDGEFPANSPADGILSETDRVMLEGCGIELSDSGRNAAGMELFWFYKAVSAARDSVSVIIPRQSGGSACTPSMGVTRIKELFPKVQTEDYDRDEPSMSVWVERDLDRFVRLRSAYGDCARRLLPGGNNVVLYGDDAAYDPSVATIPAEIMKKINGDSLRLSQSKIDKFSQCPFSYAATYTVGIEDDATAQLDPSDTGTFVHKILEEFFKETADMDFPIPEETEREICDRLFADCVKAFEERGAVSGRQRFLFARLRRSIGVFVRSLGEEFSQSLFRPWRFEQPVGTKDPESIPAPTFYLADGTEIRMRGVIDRVDVYREDGTTYVRIVDYKTGKKEFKLSDIYKGLNIQLLLYLFTVWKSPPCEFRRALAGDGEIIPAGALYFSARPGEATAETMLYGADGLITAANAASRTGLVLSDKHIIEAMDREFTGRYAPVKLDKNGDFKKNSGIADLERFGKLYLDIADIIKETGEKICGGFAGAVPTEHGGVMPCDYCSYRPICRVRNTDSGKE